MRTLMMGGASRSHAGIAQIMSNIRSYRPRVNLRYTFIVILSQRGVPFNTAAYHITPPEGLENGRLHTSRLARVGTERRGGDRR